MRFCDLEVGRKFTFRGEKWTKTDEVPAALDEEKSKPLVPEMVNAINDEQVEMYYFGQAEVNPLPVEVETIPVAEVAADVELAELERLTAPDAE